MMQHPIDLLPRSIRVRSQAGARSRRYAASVIVTICALVIASTHTRLALGRAREALLVTEREADQALATEARKQELQALLAETGDFIDLYERIALPLAVSDVLATVVNELPASVTLDRFDVDAAARRLVRTPRSKGNENDGPPPRVLTGEIGGFAESDEQIAELVGRLEVRPPFRDVSLDFSRTRLVRGRLAREFRLSFRIDLEARYDIGGPAGREVSGVG